MKRLQRALKIGDVTILWKNEKPLYLVSSGYKGKNLLGLKHFFSEEICQFISEMKSLDKQLKSSRNASKIDR
ncbi:MAG: hypothetical protein KA807_16690 [Prolixibacteraceae bacterium]|nr:hypothetical protein [Prolixibacteraceae bacterium]